MQIKSKNNLIIYVSSRNNYDMLLGEVLKNINFEGYEFINVDDCSSSSEKKKGRQICKANNIIFLENKSRGVQMATQTLIDYINSNRPECKWIFCFQHDNFPISKGFFTTISNYIECGSVNRFGLMGFNHLDHWYYTGLSYYKYLFGLRPLGAIGILYYSQTESKKKWLCSRYQSKILKNKGWRKPFIIDLPVWTSVGININLWNEVIEPTNQYHFHMWLPDISIQFNYKNIPSIVIPYLYCFNNQRLKMKYNINWDSAAGSKTGDSEYFGDWCNYDFFFKRWGFDHENPRETINLNNYKNTLIEKFYNHDIELGPLKNYDL